MSAAAFIKGLLDLEGSSLTPILVSLVTKNASMLDAFGKVRPPVPAQDNYAGPYRPRRDAVVLLLRM
jgi:hypothetical protein